MFGLMLLALVVVSCAGTRSRTWNPTAENSETLALFQIVDPKFAGLLEKAASPKEFLILVSEYKSNTVAWAEIEKRKSFCDSVCRISPITAPKSQRSVLWEYALKKGVPAGDWKISGEKPKKSGVDSLNYWLYQWSDGSTELFEGDSCPMRISLPTRTIPWEWGPIYLEVRKAILPAGKDNLYGLVINAGAPLGDINAKSFTKGKLKFSFSLNSGLEDIARGEVLANLGPYLKIARVATNVGEFYVPGYFSARLKPGTYLLRVRVDGSEGNWGEKKIPVRIPSPTTWGMSDMVFLRSNPPKGSLERGVEIWGKKLYPWPTATFQGEGKISALVEVIVPKSDDYKIEVTFLPIREAIPADKRKVQVDSNFTGVDPVQGEQYAHPDSAWPWQRMPSIIVTPSEVMSEGLIFSGSFLLNGGRSILEIPLVFQSPPGHYGLKVSLTENKEGPYHCLGTSTEVVEIKEPFSVSKL